MRDEDDKRRNTGSRSRGIAHKREVAPAAISPVKPITSDKTLGKALRRLSRKARLVADREGVSMVSKLMVSIVTLLLFCY